MTPLGFARKQTERFFRAHGRPGSGAVPIANWQIFRAVRVTVFPVAIISLAYGSSHVIRGTASTEGRLAPSRSFEPSLGRVDAFLLRPVHRDVVELPAKDYDTIRRSLRVPDASRITVSDCLHAMRARHAGAVVVDSSSQQVFDASGIFRSYPCARALIGGSPFARTRYGIRATGAGPQPTMRSRESHRDQCLASFAEVGVPLSWSLNAAGKSATVRELLLDSIANFDIDQKELPWTTVAYAVYLAPNRQWKNRYGELYCFDDLAEKLIAAPLDQASCAGTHLFYALTVIARADEVLPILGARVRDRVHDRLRCWARAVVATQRDDGSWGADWSQELNGVKPSRSTLIEPEALELLITGHLAESLAFLPKSIHLPDQTMRRAALWLIDRIVGSQSEQALGGVCAHTHALCAVLSLARPLKERSLPLKE